jgi:acyl-CoA reductase-like NAD-dependent aldehyde dehydrogenase
MHSSSRPDSLLGVVNIVTGGDETGEALVRHPGVAKVGFTCSAEGGRSVIVAAAERLARVSLELGNKGPNIIAADAELDAAIDGSLVGAFLNSGQSCAAYARFYVHISRIDEPAQNTRPE